MTEVIVAFRNFANAPKNEGVYRLCASQDLNTVPVGYCLKCETDCSVCYSGGTQFFFLTVALIRTEDTYRGFSQSASAPGRAI
jgi:hypothetical protein